MMVSMYAEYAMIGGYDDEIYTTDDMITDPIKKTMFVEDATISKYDHGTYTTDATIVDPIKKIVEKYGRDRRYVYMPNGGNLGDVFIAAATIQKFNHYGMNWVIIRGGKENLLPNDVLIYGGGGSLIGRTDGGVDCVRFLLSMEHPVVVLPQTIRDHIRFWACEARDRTNSPLMVFCRDVESRDYMLMFPHIEVALAEDMAIGFDINDGHFAAIAKLRNRIEEIGDNNTTIKIFRGDEESRRVNSLEGSLDISALSYPSLETIESININTMFFLTAMASYSNIETDRLHIAIASAILGIPCKLYDNNYGKNKAIYELSMRDRFKNIMMIES